MSSRNFDLEKYKDFCTDKDREFAVFEPEFVKWWSQHPDKDPEPRFALRPRVAWKVAFYREQFNEWRRLGSPNRPRTPAGVNFDRRAAMAQMTKQLRKGYEPF